MKTWYVNRSETGVLHRGKTIEQNKFICLSEAQAKLHGDKLEKSDDPKTILDCAFPFEHAEWLASLAAKKDSPILEETSSKQEKRSSRREERKAKD